MSDRKPLLLIASPVPPPMSGPEVMTRHLLNSSLRDGYELLHFDIGKKRDINSKGKFDLVNVFFGAAQPFQLLWLFLRRRPAALYTNMAQNLGGFLRYASFIWVSSFLGIPVVTRVMGDGFGHFYKRSGGGVRWFIRATLGRVDRMIVRAELLKAQFEGAVDMEKLRVVYSGIRVEEFERPDLVEERREGETRFLFVGYLTQAKGAFDLLRVIPEVLEEEPGARFRFMGARVRDERNIVYIDGVERPQDEVLDELVEVEGIRENCEFLGVLSGEGKVREFVNADALVFPSHAEAFPTVVLEAMAAGLPVVSTPVGVLPEAFDERGILFGEPGDLKALRESILRLIREPGLRERMSGHNRGEVCRDYTVDAYGNRVRALFDELFSEEAGS